MDSNVSVRQHSYQLSLAITEDMGKVVLQVKTNFGAAFIMDPPFEATKMEALLYFISPCCGRRVYGGRGAKLDSTYCGSCDAFLGHYASAQRIRREGQTWRLGNASALENFINSCMDPLEATLVTAAVVEVVEQIYNDQDWALGNLDTIVATWDGARL